MEAVDGLAGIWVADVAEYDGSVWVATNNGGVLEWKDGFVSRRVLPPDIPAAEVFSLQVFDGRLWVGTTRGIAVYDGREWEAIGTVTADDGAGGTVEVVIRNCRFYAGHDEKRLWLAPLALGGRLMMREAGKEAWNIFDPGFGTILDNITAVLDLGDDLYLGTTASGIYRYQQGRRQILRKEEGLLDNRINALDAEGNAVLAGHPAGLSRFADGEWTPITSLPRVRNFSVTSLKTVFTNGDSYRLIGTREGLLVHDLTFDRVTYYGQDNGLAGNRVMAIRDIGGDIWVGAPRGAAWLRFEP